MEKGGQGAAEGRGSADDSQKWVLWDFTGGPVVKTPCFQCRGGACSIPGLGTMIPHAARLGQKKKKKNSGFFYFQSYSMRTGKNLAGSVRMDLLLNLYCCLHHIWKKEESLEEKIFR